MAEMILLAIGLVLAVLAGYWFRDWIGDRDGPR